jgi:hypothetical protein
MIPSKIKDSTIDEVKMKKREGHISTLVSTK